MAQLRQGKESKKHLTPSCMPHLARGDIAQLVEPALQLGRCDYGVGCLIVQALESAALLGSPHLGSLGKRIKLALANSLMHYLPSTLERNVAKGRKTHGPTPSSPPRRNYEITPKDAFGIQGSQTDHRPCSISGTH
ncbi:hypothetical protein H6P81_000011 [Aristolochia fimbriata]|uniref:Uncharacterized protein n=1 Tax=Aristolochia fimbriata TaxID=158543 RepID=A0AAV7F3A8_ARIFI|nr:hypothetical protein H6P81_000011 [Aristolochia fimbriata]